MITKQARSFKVTGRLLNTLVVATSLLYGQGALGQAYPDKPVRFVVGLAPGGGVDFVARLLGQKLSQDWSQPVVIENRAGANQIIAAEMVAKSKPDGSTVLIVNPAHTVNPTFYPKLPYNTLTDFDPITLIAQYPFLLIANPSLAARNVKELIAVAKAKPGQLSYGSSGNGSAPHLGMELFKAKTNVNIVHVPYKGAGDALRDLVSGQVQLMLLNLAPIKALLDSGKLRVLAVASAQRSAGLPNVPTASEAGLRDFNYFGWYGMVVPAGTPSAIKSKLHGDVVKALRTPEVSQKLSAENNEPVGNSPDEFADFLKKEIATFASVIKTAGIKIK